jgi:hypothetical protein
MNDNDDETLDYTSSVDPFSPEKDDPSVDAPDERALVKLARVLAQEKATYGTIDGMKRFEKTVNTAIGNIKEKQNGRR